VTSQSAEPAERWQSVAKKLRDIKQEFEENDSRVSQIRADIAGFISQLNITGDQLDRARSETPATEPVRDSSLKRKAVQRAAAPVDPLLVKEINDAVNSRSELVISVHLEQLTTFISDQHAEVEALRKLQSVLIQMNPDSTQSMLDHMDKLAYTALLQFFDKTHDPRKIHQNKVEYLDKLIGYALQAANS
jgi:hypothetical protein